MYAEAFDNHVVVLWAVREKARRAILDAVGQKDALPSAFRKQIQRTVTEQTVERFQPFVTGKIGALSITEKTGTVFHDDLGFALDAQSEKERYADSLQTFHKKENHKNTAPV